MTWHDLITGAAGLVTPSVLFGIFWRLGSIGRGLTDHVASDREKFDGIHRRLTFLERETQ